MRRTIFPILVFLALTSCGCVANRMVQYQLYSDSFGNPPKGGFIADWNGLSNLDNGQCSQCVTVHKDGDAFSSAVYCEFNLNLVKLILGNGQEAYEMRMEYFGDSPFVMTSGPTLVLTLDGKETVFSNDDSLATGGAFYPVTEDQLQAIISAKSVRVKIIGRDETVLKCFGPENQQIFQKFLDDMDVNAGYMNAGFPSSSDPADNVQVISPVNIAKAQYLEQVQQTPLLLKMPKAKAADAWRRAQTLLAQLGTIQIQTLTDQLIQTKNTPDPNGNAYFAYTLTKIPAGNAYQITVKCVHVTAAGLQSDADSAQNAEILAYYLSTGVIKQELIQQ
jgi:hypothetical protein